MKKLLVAVAALVSLVLIAFGVFAHRLDDAVDAESAVLVKRLEELDVAALKDAALEPLDCADMANARLPDFIGGRLRWLDGPMRGVWQDIAAVEGANLRLTAPPVLPVQTPARVQLIEGCDHSLPTCVTRFGNVANFRGEPHLPGMDLITRYPGG